MNYLFNYNEDYLEINGIRMVDANSKEEAIRKFIINVVQTDDKFYDYIFERVFSGDIDIKITPYDTIQKVD